METGPKLYCYTKEMIIVNVYLVLRRLKLTAGVRGTQSDEKTTMRSEC